MATPATISPDGLETKEIAAISAVLTADIAAAITTAGGTAPSGASLTSLVTALVVDITGALGTARNLVSGGNFPYTIQ